MANEPGQTIPFGPVDGVFEQGAADPLAFAIRADDDSDFGDPIGKTGLE